jgi:hypothetical protein
MYKPSYRLIPALVAALAAFPVSISARSDWLVQTYLEPYIWNLNRADALIGGWGNAGAPMSVSLSEWNTADNASFPGGGGVFNPNFQSPASGDWFAVQGKGSIIVTAAGDYRFTNNTDDGSRLRIDGSTIILDDVLSADHDASGTIHLNPGIHSIEWTWFEAGGGAQGEVSYENLTAPGTGRQLLGMAGTAGSANGITLDASATVTGYKGNVSIGPIDTLSKAADLAGDPTKLFGSGLFPTFNSVEGLGADGCFGGGVKPPGLVSADNDDFAVTGTGYLRVTTEGDYRFAQLTDDGGALRLNGIPIIVDDSLHAANCPSDVKYSPLVHLTAGYHALEFIYFERAGGASGEVFLVDANNNPIALLGDVANGGLEVTQTVSQVPEPVTLALLGIGLAGLGFSRRRRRADN